jgi:hypothetical protein
MVPVVSADRAVLEGQFQVFEYVDQASDVVLAELDDIFDDGFISDIDGFLFTQAVTEVLDGVLLREAEFHLCTTLFDVGDELAVLFVGDEDERELFLGLVVFEYLQERVFFACKGDRFGVVKDDGRGFADMELADVLDVLVRLEVRCVGFEPVFLEDELDGYSFTDAMRARHDNGRLRAFIFGLEVVQPNI